MKELEKGVKILRRDPAETQEEFKDDVCTEYNEFLEDFVIEGGAYYELYQAMLTNANKKGPIAEDAFKSKFATFAAKKITRIIEVAREKHEAPIPDTAYYRSLYNKYKESDKSPNTINSITGEFLSSLNGLSREIDSAYDKISPSAAD